MKQIFATAIPTARRVLAFILALAATVRVNADETQKSFTSPEAAVAALTTAVMTTNRAELRIIFGPAADKLENPDPVQAAKELAAFASAVHEKQRLVRESDHFVLEVGDDSWPFPVPIMKANGRWYFNTEDGLDELLNRRIGENELETLNFVRTYVQAQREYASRDRNGDDVLQYAQKIISTPGAKDGLFWSPDLDGEISPLGPFAADAADEGYKKNQKNPDQRPQPFHGYYFKILTRQGKYAPGGKHGYITNGKMIDGFALVAWPAQYGNSGIMTFIVNQQGRVYQKDLGAKTAKAAEAMKAYDPDKTWALSED